jgi:hypothetical protein
MDKEILCKKCLFWVDCSKENKVEGFCLCRDLYSITAETECADYENGEPMTEQEYEDENARIY